MELCGTATSYLILEVIKSSFLSQFAIIAIFENLQISQLAEMVGGRRDCHL